MTHLVGLQKGIMSVNTEYLAIPGCHLKSSLIINHHPRICIAFKAETESCGVSWHGNWHESWVAMRYSYSGDFQESAARARSAAILQRSLPSRPSGNSPAPSGSASPREHPTAAGQMANVCEGSVHKSKSRIPQEREQTRYRLWKDKRVREKSQGNQAQVRIWGSYRES